MRRIGLDRDGNVVYVTYRSRSHVFRVLDGRDGNELRRCTLPIARPGGFGGSLPWACNTPQATFVAVRESAQGIVLFETKQGKEQRRLTLKAKARATYFADADSMVFTPDGTALAVVSEGNLIEVFDVTTGKKRCDLAVPLKRVDHLDFSPDGRHLYCGGKEQGRLLVRNWAGAREHVRLDFPGYAPNVAFAPDSRSIAFGAYDAGHIGIHSVADGKEARRLEVGKDYEGMLAFSPDGQTLATASRGAISQWRVATGERLAASAEPIGAITLQRFTADGKHLLVYTNRHVLFDALTGRHVRDRAAAESRFLGEALLSASERVLAVPREREFLLLDARTGKEVRRLPAPGANADRHQCIAGKRLCALGSDNVIRVWDVQTCEPIVELQAGRGESSWLDASPDGRYLAQNINDWKSTHFEVRLWDIGAGRLLHRFTPSGSLWYDRVVFAPDGGTLAFVMGHRDRPPQQIVTVLDVLSGKEIRAISVPQGGISCLAFASDGRALATNISRKPAVLLWELASGKVRHSFVGHKNWVTSLVFSRDSALLASSSDEAPAYVWDIYGKHGKKQAAPWTADEGQRLWQSLADGDAQAAFQAIRRLVGSPIPAVALLRAHCKAAAAVDAKRVRQWLRDLDSDDSDTRDIASRKLQQLGDRIEGTLSDARRGKLGPEATRRIDALLAKRQRTTPVRLRHTRALEALEQIATPEAVRLLETLAAGESGAQYTRGGGDVGRLQGADGETIADLLGRTRFASFCGRSFQEHRHP